MIKVNDTILEISHFPDGTLAFIGDNISDICLWEVFGEDVPVITWKFESNEEMIALMFLVNHIKAHGYKDIDLYMPYIPNARMDRTKSEKDVFTLKYFCEFINSLGFRMVSVLDPHSYVSEALINNIRVKNPDGYILQAIKRMGAKGQCNSIEDWMLFYPDSGAMKRYSTNLPYKYAFGIKNRDWETGKIESLDVAGCVDEIKGKTILIIDDICSRGGTFVHSAKKLKELGAKAVYLYVSHCENTILEGELLESGLIEKVFTTDSIFTKEHEKIEVFKL